MRKELTSQVPAITITSDVEAELPGLDTKRIYALQVRYRNHVSKRQGILTLRRGDPDAGLLDEVCRYNSDEEL